MKTRERIKQTAIELFNQKGATNVSTVQLSDKLVISPGNLYYYFTNKEHIIRSIWEEDMLPQVHGIFFREHDPNTHLAIFNLLEALTEHSLKYQFFYIEMYTLIRNDPLLRESYLAHWDLSVGRMTDFFADWEATGQIKATKGDFKQILAENLLLIGPATVHNSLTLHPETDARDAMRKSVVSVCVVICGLLTDKAKQELMDKLTENNYPVRCG